MGTKGNGIFFAEGLTDLRTVGTLVCTSRFVAHAMAPEIQREDPPKAIVEFGVGIGNVTREIIKRLRPQDFFIGVDANEKFVELCRNNVAYAGGGLRVHIEHAFAQDIDRILSKHQIQEVDEIVCTLPFRTLPRKDTREILEKAKRILKRGGYFSFIRYVIAPENKDVFRSLEDFEVVERKVVMRNFPPAEVVRMRKN